MRYRILGPLELLDDEGRPIAVGGRRERVLLAALLLEANRVVSSDRLTEIVWGEHPPDKAANALQVLISKLRKTLAVASDADGPLATWAPGYILHASPGELDAEQFEQLAALSGPDDRPSVVSARLDRALALWRGSVLDGLAMDAFGRADIARLEELRASVLERRIDADLALGRHRDLIGELEALVRTHPLREELRGQLMVALYRSGRQADALAAYRQARQVLADELGIDPSPALQALELDILNQSAELQTPSMNPETVAPPDLPSGTVTLLWAGIESTAHRTDQPAATSSEAWERYAALVRSAVEGSGGYVFRSADGAICAAFTTAQSAVQAASEAQRALAAEQWPEDGMLQVSMALHTGECEERDGQYLGPALHRVARLEAAAEGGQIVLSRATADVVRDHLPRYLDLRELGPLHLNDLSRPEEAFQLDIRRPKGLSDKIGTSMGTEAIGGSATLTPVTIPLPGRLAVRPPVGIVGRQDELRFIADAYRRVAAGGSREVLLVLGEAGLGKTTLVAEASRIAFDDGACVLFGHCEEDLTNPYQFFAEALGHYVAHVAEDRLLAHVRTHGSELARLVPALSNRVPGLPPSKGADPDTERYLLFAATVGLLANASQHQPVVLVLDDLQWADKGSLSLLRHLAGAELAERVLILATYRDSELGHADALRDTLGALRRHDGVGRVELVGLDDSEVVAYLEAASGQTLDDDGVDLAHAVHRETDGNPFFVSEVLRHLTETGAIYRDSGGRWVAEGAPEQIALPDSVREVIGGRVVRLGREAERALSLAAVIGRDFDLDLLSRATGVSEDELLDILDAAAGVALVGELHDAPGRFSFTHALIQHTLYEDLGPTRCARAHRLVAEALESLCGGHTEARVGELARHWVAAVQPIDLVKAIDYSRQAGDAALSALAPADAIRYYSQALDLNAQHPNSDPTLELDLTIGLGTAMRQIGDPAFRNTLLEAYRQALSLGDTDRLVAAVLANDRGTFSTAGVADDEKIEALETALERLTDENADRALVLATMCTELTIGSSIERRQALANEALAIAHRIDDDATVARVINHVLLPLAVPHVLELSLARSSEALARAVLVGDPLLVCTAASGRRLISACAGDIAEMDRCFDIKQPIVERLDLPFLNWVHMLQRATRALIAGDSDDAERLATKALQIGTDGGQPDAAIVFGAQIIMVHLWRGTSGTLIPLIEQAIDDNPGLPVFVAALALAHAESDHTAETRRLLAEFAEADFELPLDATWLTGMIAYADSATECRDPRFVGPILEQLHPFSDQWLYTDVATSGPVSRSVGDLLTVLGRYREAESHFERSAASSERAGAKFFATRTELSWARMLTERRGPGDSERAHHLLARAHATATAQGYGTVERRAAAVLESLDS
jgi:DNA-binding SARP family transcriptional activator